MKVHRVTYSTKITFAIFVFVALSFIISPHPCPAEPLPSAQIETVVVLWQVPAPLASAGFDSSYSENDPDTATGSLSPIHQAFLNSPEPSLPSSPTETMIILWQDQKSAGTFDPEPSSGPSDSDSSRRQESLDTSPEDATPNETIADPLEPVNRVFFQFNDKLYFWALKPVASVYKAILTQDLRVGIRNFFSNLTTPIRFANCLLQGEFKGAGNEAARFAVNTTLGFLGLFDQAKDKFEIDKQERDLGQTLGIWGFGPAFYINWPILGPSSLRDTAGFVGDLFLDPRTYLLDRTFSIVVRPFEMVNDTSLRIGEYEAFKKAALDPYVAMRDGYYQYRQNKIKTKK